MTGATTTLEQHHGNCNDRIAGYRNPHQIHSVASLSQEYFGDVILSMLSLFQLMTLDSWTVPVAGMGRPEGHRCGEGGYSNVGSQAVGVHLN